MSPLRICSSCNSAVLLELISRGRFPRDITKKRGAQEVHPAIKDKDCLNSRDCGFSAEVRAVGGSRNSSRCICESATTTSRETPGGLMARARRNLKFRIVIFGSHFAGKSRRRQRGERGETMHKFKRETYRSRQRRCRERGEAETHFAPFRHPRSFTFNPSSPSVCLCFSSRLTHGPRRNSERVSIARRRRRGEGAL